MTSLYHKLTIAKRHLPNDSTLGDCINAGYLTHGDVELLVQRDIMVSKAIASNHQHQKGGGFLLGLICGGLFR